MEGGGRQIATTTGAFSARKRCSNWGESTGSNSFRRLPRPYWKTSKPTARGRLSDMTSNSAVVTRHRFAFSRSACPIKCCPFSRDEHLQESTPVPAPFWLAPFSCLSQFIILANTPQIFQYLVFLGGLILHRCLVAVNIFSVAS